MRSRLLAGAAAGLLLTGCAIGKDESNPAEPVPSSVLRGVEQNGYVLGDPSAPATLVVYAYVTTPAFSDWVRDELPELVRRDVRPGKLKIELRTVSSALNDNDVLAAQLLQAAGMRDELWNALLAFDARYAGVVDDENADDVLRDAGIPAPSRRQILGLRNNSRVINAIDRATNQAREAKLRSATRFVLTADGRSRRLSGPDLAASVGRALSA